MPAERDLTGLLQAWNEGDQDALTVFATVVHHDLRQIARRLLADERRDGQWRPTELVHESYLRLLDWRAVQWQNRSHFFATASRMMRRVLDRELRLQAQPASRAPALACTVSRLSLYAALESRRIASRL
jgi:hypothetical protein